MNEKDFNILKNSDEIKYIYFMINNKLIHYKDYTEDFKYYKDTMSDMQNLYKLLTKLIGKKTVNILDNDVELISPSKQTKKDKLIEMTDDEFLDATEGEKTETEIDDENSEKSDAYNNSDDSDTVFRKATKNTSVRTTKRVNKGSNVKNLTK
jgi:hypothetical protein